MKENFKEKQDYNAPVTKAFDIGPGSAMLQDITASGGSGASGTIDPWGEDDEE